jgi:hypothetical protein
MLPIVPDLRGNLHEVFELTIISRTALVGRIENMKIHTKFESRNPKRTDHLGNLDSYGRIILKCDVRKQTVRICSVFMWPRIGPSVGNL